MGCASSAPFMGDGGPLGEIKGAAHDMIETGEHAFHDMGEAANKTVHDAMDHVKGAVNNAAHGLQGAAAHVGTAAGEAVHSLTGGAKQGADTLSAPALPPPLPAPDPALHIPLKPPSEDLLDDLIPTRSPSLETTISPSERFKPTPVPSFDKPPTPNATVTSLSDILEAPMEKIEELGAGFSIDELTDDLMKETAAVMAESAEAAKDGDPADLESDLRPTKWEALADAIVELPPRMSIDLGTGQLYAVVDDEPPPPRKGHHSRVAVVKEVVDHSHT